jgi:IS5 family transposase
MSTREQSKTVALHPRPEGRGFTATWINLDGYRVSQKKRKRIEEVFGWMKTVGLLRKLRHRGLEQVGWVFTFTAAAYNLVRIRNLTRSTPQPKCA